MFALNMKILFDYLPIDVIQLFFGFNAISCRTILILLPTVSTFIKNHEIHPLFIFGLVILLVAYLKQFLKEIDYECDDFIEINIE